MNIMFYISVACLFSAIACYAGYMGWFKKKLPEEPKLITKTYKVGKLIATITDINDKTYLSTFEGRVDYLNGKIYIMTAGEWFDEYLLIYGKSGLFAADDDKLIPSHRIKLISYTEDEDFDEEFSYYEKKVIYTEFC